MRSVDDNSRGHSRIIIGFILILSSIINVFFENYNDYLANGSIFVFGIILFVWGQMAMNKTRGNL